MSGLLRVIYSKNLSKKERRDNSKKAFTERIITNINFKKCFKDKHQPKIDGKQVCIRQVLMGWKSIQKEKLNLKTLMIIIYFCRLEILLQIWDP